VHNRVLCTNGNFDSTPVRDLDVALKIPYVCDSAINLRRKQAELIQKYVQKKRRSHEEDKLGSGQANGRSSNCLFRAV
jgi:hypothetical protein